MFEELGVIGNTIILFISFIIIDRASDLTINHSIKVASVTGLGKTTIGFILVAFSTSLPELFIAIFAVITPENTALSIGNVLGANIKNIALALGICLIFMALKSSKGTFGVSIIAKEELGSLYFGLFIASIVPLSLLYIGYASRFIGILLVGLFIFYMYQLSKRKLPQQEALSEAERSKLRIYVALTMFGTLGIVASAFLIVETASFIAVSFGVPKIIIGATIVAIGTTMPELVTSIYAVKKGHLDMTLGNIVGSSFINITAILGVALIASPVRIEAGAFSNIAVFSLIVNLLLWYFLSSNRIGLREGVILVFMYFLFLAVTLGAIQF